MKVHEYREMMRYLTRKPLSEQELQIASSVNQQMLDSTPPTPVASGEKRVEYSEGSKLTGTDKTLEKNIRDDHKAFNDYRKSIGSPTIPLDNEYIRMWIRSRLNSGGPANKQPPKFIPMDLESVAFRLFRDNLDNLTYNQKQTVYDHIEDNRNKKANGGRIGYETGGGVSEEQNLIEEILSGKIKIGANFTNKNKDDPFNKYGFGKKDIKDPRLGIEYNMDPGNERSSKIGISVGPKGGSISFMKPFSEKLNEEKNENIVQTYIDFARNVWGVEVTEQEARKALGIYDMPNTSIRNELPPEEIEGKANGGRIKLQNGSDDGYMQEIPSLGFSDPIDILEQQLINEKDSTRIDALYQLLDNAKKERKAKETEAAEYKKSQKEKGVKYKEDFPSEAAYFAETGKQLLTNPKYFLGKGAKGIVEGTEFLVGQPLQTLFDQEGKNFEFYKMVGGEKLGINKFIEENIPKNPTTGTLLAGETAEIAGSVMDPFLAYGLAKGAIKGTKAKPPTTAVDEKIDPTRRDILKTGVVMGTGAALYPTAKKLGMFDEIAKGARVARVLPAAKGMPEWFSPLVSRIENKGLDITAQAKEAQKLEYKKMRIPPSNAADREIVQSRKIELPTTGKKPEIITMTEYKNGNIHIESNTSGGAFDSPYDLYYSPPREVTEIQNIRDKDGNLRKTEVKVKKDGEFTVIEQRPFFNPKYEGDNALELEYIERNFDDSISDVEKLEEFATGKKVDPKKNEKRKEYKKYAEENPSDDAASLAPDEDRSYYDQ